MLIVNLRAPLKTAMASWAPSLNIAIIIIILLIQGVIARVISKSDEHEVRGQFEITNMITP